MRFKEFVWPHNPSVYAIDYARKLQKEQVPYGRYLLRDMGFTWRVLRGEGEFVGKDAYLSFKKLAEVFYQAGPGTLVHPIWQTTNAYFTALSLQQTPKADYVQYSFEFTEDYEEYQTGLMEVNTTQNQTEKPQMTEQQQALWHTVARGETMWGIARSYDVELNTLILQNPQIKNPNLILVGQRLRIK